jgi:hypothetical protein
MKRERHYWAEWKCPCCRRAVPVHRCFSKREMYTLFCPHCWLRIFYFNADAVGLRGVKFRRKEYR